MELAAFKDICSTQCHLQRDSLVLVAFSGGADSLSLLICLQKAGYKVMAAHFNHHLRSDADKDEQSARQKADHLGIPFLSGWGDVPALVREKKFSVEEAARQLRYRWLFEQAQSYQAQAVAVGHTADDQVETVLMHLLRGTGLDGLTGMPFRQMLPVWHPYIPVIRPLLSTWRTETEEICLQANLEPVQDESNQSAVYFRNRIRLELIPFLQGYNPQVKSHLLQTAQILAEEQNLLNSVKENAWRGCYRNQDKLWISFDLSRLQILSEGLRRSVLRRGLLELEPEIRDIDFKMTERLSEFVFHSTRSGEMFLSHSLWIQKTTTQLIIWKGKPGLVSFHPQVEFGKEYALSLPGRLSFPGWEIEVREDELITAREAIQLGQLENQVWLDADCLSFPLVVRCGQPGERISPLGMGGKTQKLSDYWINRKIPRQARLQWPLIFSGPSIIWVTGLGISDYAAITPRTQRVVQISLQILNCLPAGSIYC